MKTHNLIQGSPEWHAHRATHFNASDAPAMMGCSPYMNRTQLMHRMKTGISQEVDAATQRRFDDGHRFEALARPLAEEIIGEDLYPVTGSEGELSASFDGLTMSEDVAFEHKTLNDELRAVLVEGCTGDVLPLMYRIQMEQQIIVSGASRVLFMASKWAGEELVEERHCWYEGDAELAARVILGWQQFARELADYHPTEAAPEVVGRTPETLPALRIEVTGAVTASNLGAFKTHALEVFAGINKDLKSDQDFADAEKAVKWCGDVEDRLAAAKQHALSQTESIDALFRTIDDISAEARRVRLDLDKLVKARKEAIRGDLVTDGVMALREHIAALNTRLGKSLMPSVPADFGGAIKGKKTVASIKDAVSTVLATAKIEANRVADLIDANLKTIAAAEHDTLFPDVGQLVLKAADDLAAVIASRIATHKAAEEAKAKPVEAPVAAPAPAPAVISMPVRAAAAPVADTGARLTLGQINTRIAPLQITVAGLLELGFQHVGKDKAAFLFRAADFPLICAALVEHVQAVQAREAA